MKTSLITRIAILSLTVIAATEFSFAQQKKKATDPFPKNAWGVYTWMVDANKVNPKDYPEMKGAPLVLSWKKLEPENGVYKFDEVIGKALKHMAGYNYYTFLKVYYAPDNFTPAWIFESGGVPRVEFPPRMDPFRQMIKPGFPYFFDKHYIEYYYRFIHELAEYVKGLPKTCRTGYCLYRRQKVLRVIHKVTKFRPWTQNTSTPLRNGKNLG